MKTQIILASASPRRSELLKQIGVTHQIHAVDIDETPLPNECPSDYVQRLAAEKSAHCQALTAFAQPILAADTTVAVDGRILGKPENLQQAISMLNLLSGNTHQVYTAVSLRGVNHDQALSVSEVTFKTLSLAEITAYWRTGEPCDKAGAYAIQGLGGIFIAHLKGSYSGVMGLPLFETAALLNRQGIKVII